MVRQLGDVNHAVLAGQQLDKRAEVHDAHDLARVHLANLDVLRDALDDAARLVGCFRVGGGDEHAAVVLDVNLHAGFGNNLVDHLAAGSDNLANLLRIDGEADNLGRVLAQFLARLADAAEHLFEDEQAALERLRQRGFENRAVNARNLDVHLDGGDAVHRASDLEVHVAQEVFQALNVGQDSHLARLHVLNQAHRDARDRRVNRHARVHQGQGGTAHGRHGGRAVGGQDFAHQAHCVGELFLRGDDGQQCALRQCAVADFAATGALEAPRFARGVRRHIVVVDVALEVLAGQAIQHLTLAGRAQRGHGQRLRLTTGKHGRAMHARQHAHFAPNRADFRHAAAVGTNALLDNLLAHDFLVQVVQRISDFGFALRELLRQRFDGFLLHLRFTRLTLLTVEGVEHPHALVVGEFAHGLLHVVAGHVQRHFDLFLADFRHNLVLELNELLDVLVAEHDGVEHRRFADLVRARFHHHDGVLRAGKVNVHIALCALLFIGVDDVLPVHAADNHRARRAVPRDFADRQRDGRTDHRGDFRRHILLNAQHGHNNLHIVAHSLVEQGAQRAVDQAAGQGRLFGRTAFTLDEAAGNLAHRVLLFLHVHSQREEVHAGTGGRRHRRVHHHDGIAQMHPDGASRLFAVFAEFQRQLAARQIHAVLFAFH